MRRMLLMSLAIALVAPKVSLSQAKLPSTPVREVTDEYFGTKVEDPYRWLENGSDPEVVSWMKSQDDFTRAALAAIPAREKFLARVSALDQASTRVRNAQVWGGKLFYLKTDPGADNSKLYVRDSLEGKERLLVDPEPLTKDKVHFSIDYFQPSLDGKLVIYGVSPGGSEDSVLHVIETDTGRLLSESIDRTRFGIVGWLPGNRSFFYNRLQKLTPDMPRTAFEQRSRVYVHELGQDPEKDRFVFGHGYLPEVKDNDISFLVYTPASPYVFAGIAHGTENENTLYYVPVEGLKKTKVEWKKLFDVDQAVTRFDAHGDDLYLVTHKHSPRYEVVKTSLKHPDLSKAETVVPASEVVIQEVDVAQDGVYIRDLDGGIGRLRRLTFSGAIDAVPMPEGKSASELSTTPNVPGALIHVVSWTTSPAWLHYDPSSKSASDSGIQPPISIDTSAFEALEVKATSEDGTMVPLSIIRPKGLSLDGTHPTHLIGYGAYGLSLEARFDPVWVAWLERGGVIAFAHVRGGGEYGEEWYRAGYKLSKQHTIDDFLASAEYMIEKRYTTAEHLSGEGTSAGGILIGGAITQRPELFAAALIRVGCSDALRMEFEPNGPPNIAEFGTVKEPDGFKGLFAMDAYQHVKDGTRYPAVLLTAGINDPRVDPAQPAKMTARLQAATASGKPVLLRVDYDAGHGIGSTRSQHDLEYADEASFLLWQEGTSEFQPAK